jgi:hypothetical protein
MLNNWRAILVILALATYSIWIWWWASSGFPLEGQICEQQHTANNCEGYNILVYSALKVAATADHWSAFITAIATGFVARFTWTLWRSSEKSWRTATESIDLARKEFISTHRPKIILRAAYTGDLKEGHIIPIRLHIANTGETKAKIISSTLRITELPGDQRPAGGAPFELENVMDQTELEAGGSMLMPAGRNVPKWNGERFLKKWRPTTNGPQPYRTFQIWLTGQMIYIDDLGISRRTSFYRVLDPERQRFYTVDEPDLDYSD